jgi:predicted nucleotidyltransferase
MAKNMGAFCKIHPKKCLIFSCLCIISKFHVNLRRYIKQIKVMVIPIKPLPILKSKVVHNQRASQAYLNLLRECKQEYAEKYGVTRMGIFGSVARGEQTENSDVDIYIEAPPMGLFALSGLNLTLEELLGVPVDIVRMHRNMNPKFKERIERDIIYV